MFRFSLCRNEGDFRCSVLGYLWGLGSVREGELGLQAGWVVLPQSPPPQEEYSLSRGTSALGPECCGKGPAFSPLF